MRGLKVGILYYLNEAYSRSMQINEGSKTVLDSGFHVLDSIFSQWNLDTGSNSRFLELYSWFQRPGFPFSKQYFSPEQKIYIQVFNQLFSFDLFTNVICPLWISLLLLKRARLWPRDSGESSLLSSVILLVRWIAKCNFNKIFRLH